MPEQLLVVALDVTDQAQIAAAFNATKERFGRLDVVVNNAGYAVLGEVEIMPESEARHLMETLFWGPVHITQQVSFIPGLLSLIRCSRTNPLFSLMP